MKKIMLTTLPRAAVKYLLRESEETHGNTSAMNGNTMIIFTQSCTSFDNRPKCALTGKMSATIRSKMESRC